MILVYFLSKKRSTIAMNHWVSYRTVHIFHADPIQHRGALKETGEKGSLLRHP